MRLVYCKSCFHVWDFGIKGDAEEDLKRFKKASCFNCKSKKIERIGKIEEILAENERLKKEIHSWKLRHQGLTEIIIHNLENECRCLEKKNEKLKAKIIPNEAFYADMEV